jgi:hypothetical protein
LIDENDLFIVESNLNKTFLKEKFGKEFIEITSVLFEKIFVDK